MSIVDPGTTVSPTVVTLTCPDCGDTLESDFFDLAVYEGSRTMICDACTSHHYHKCEGCSHWVHDDEVQDMGPGHYKVWMCDDCQDAYEVRTVEPDDLDAYKRLREAQTA